MSFYVKQLLSSSRPLVTAAQHWPPVYKPGDVSGRTAIDTVQRHTKQLAVGQHWPAPFRHSSIPIASRGSSTGALVQKKQNADQRPHWPPPVVALQQRDNLQGYLAHSAAKINNSPRVQPTTQLQQGINPGASLEVLNAIASPLNLPAEFNARSCTQRASLGVSQQTRERGYGGASIQMKIMIQQQEELADSEAVKYASPKVRKLLESWIDSHETVSFRDQVQMLLLAEAVVHSKSNIRNPKEVKALYKELSKKNEIEDLPAHFPSQLRKIGTKRLGEQTNSFESFRKELYELKRGTIRDYLEKADLSKLFPQHVKNEVMDTIVSATRKSNFKTYTSDATTTEKFLRLCNQLANQDNSSLTRTAGFGSNALNTKGKRVKRSGEGEFEAGEGAKWHVHHDHVKFGTNQKTRVNFAGRTQEAVLNHLNEVLEAFSTLTKGSNVATLEQCKKWIRAQLR